MRLFGQPHREPNLPERDQEPPEDRDFEAEEEEHWAEGDRRYEELMDKRLGIF